MNILMLFLDGVGLGGTNPAENPFAAGYASVFSSLLGEGGPPRLSSDDPGNLTTVLRLDATLGVDGLPQSGTGQTTLFTGVNASKVLGRHFGPYPHSSLHDLLRKRNIFAQLGSAGFPACFANAFPSRFFEHRKAHPSRLSVTTLSCDMSGVPIRGVDELVSGNAVSADITGAGWAELGHPEVPVIPPETAAERLLFLTRSYRFVLFEYWKTDHAGHAMDFSFAHEVLSPLDRMLSGILERIDENTLLLITSDHGNIEDLSTKVHTTNPVPLILHGKGHARMSELVKRHGGKDLSCVTPAIIDALSDAP
jgi:hypothetical protein